MKRRILNFLVIFQVFIQHTFCQSLCHPPPDIFIVHAQMNRLPVSAQTPENVIPVFVAVSDPLSIAVCILFGHSLIKCLSHPVAAHDQLPPHRQKQHIKSIRLCPVKNPVQIFKIFLIRGIQVVIEQGFLPGRISHLHILLRIQRHDLQHGKSLIFPCFHIIFHNIPFDALRHCPHRICQPCERRVVRMDKIAVIFRDFQFFHMIPFLISYYDARGKRVL